MERKNEQAKSAESRVGNPFDELVDRLDEFLAEAAFNFTGSAWDSLPWLKTRPWLRECIATLSPETQELEDALVKILPSEPTADLDEPSADFMHYTNLVKEFSYLAGILMGARLAGMDERRLRRLAALVGKMEGMVDTEFEKITDKGSRNGN